MKCIICGKEDERMYIGIIREISVPLCREHKLSCNGCQRVECNGCPIKEFKRS
ncbi:MAG: hypothetical protein GXO64_00725 [Candidatus Micrarchaeota archaeon]|nr:hypothetical protein [Candidatus Micrarchaeota archaeon]